MKTTQLIYILFLISFISCKKEITDTTFKIFHLNPNRIYTDTTAANGKIEPVSQEENLIDSAKHKFL